MKKLKGGGWPSLFYAMRKARGAGVGSMAQALRSNNACKTCALGMGGQRGGMVNEKGSFPEVCKKSIQAMAADMQGPIHPRFFEKFSLEQLRAFSPRELESAGRLVDPLYAGPEDSHYRRISWDEATSRVAGKLKESPAEQTFFYFSGRSSNEAAFSLQLFARLYGTSHIHNCSYYCHQASGVGLASVTGSGTATVELEDIDGADLLFLIGANPPSNHPRLMRSIVELKRRGGSVIVINPLKEAGLVQFNLPSDIRSLLGGSQIADLYVQPDIGGDLALLSGVAKAVIARGAIDEGFLASHAEGWEAFRSHIDGLSWDALTAGSGVARPTIERIAEIYAGSKNAIFCWSMGITQHAHGVGNVQMIANLAILRGMLGQPFRGLLPLRGHSNVQGVGSMGAVPMLKPAVRERLEAFFNVALSDAEGLDTLACLEQAHQGAVRCAFNLGGNLFGASPDPAFAEQALRNIDLNVYLNTTLNTGHAWGLGKETLILPVLARDEERQPTTQESMFNFVRMSDGGITRYAGPRSEVEIVAAIAAEVLGDSTPVDWAAMGRHDRIRAAIAEIIPGYQDIGTIDRSRKEFHVGGRLFHQPVFATDTGRARMHVPALPPPRNLGAAELRLTTLRSEGQFNTVVYEEEDLYRGQERRDVVLMNQADIGRLGLAVDQRVTVSSSAGALANVLVRAIDIPPGNAAMYFPEANVLVPRSVDPQSRTPAFKNVIVRIERVA